MADALADRLDQTIDQLIAARDATSALADPELSPLALLASELRTLPSASFKARLRATFERRTAMSTVLETINIREGFTTVTPYLVAPDTRLRDFLVAALGAVETGVTETPRGVHRELRIGDSMVMLGEGSAEGGMPASRTAFHVYVPDVDAAFDRAIAAGGTSLDAPADRPYGERSGFVEDMFGNHWYIATKPGASYLPQGFRTLTPFLHPRNAGPYIDFLTRAFGATEEFRAEDGGVVRHAQLRIGNAVIEMGESGDEADKRRTTLYLYVADCDALYDQAVAAGATSLAAPADQWYGDRVASVRDMQGITWYIARPA